eukprot:CAMPEP_0184504190 /NCGR_PEP_ID=MMETSP0113_2-20130426/52331_1 /TAXON_ID=91329 /ORGANISM="Norrisiella sphaerica, Strain BC52" /LENGTH=903 /DNA_ID=CAMNT_0026893813 /DNA_START=94 /DNA_END=2805 /DNA_ORIENTATION=-
MGFNPEEKKGAHSKNSGVKINEPLRPRLERGKSRLTISDVSADDLQLVSKVSLECIDCVESLVEKAKSIHAPYDLRDLSLTLATIERQLFNYVSDHLLRSRRLLPRLGHGSGNLWNTRQERRTLKAAISRAHEMLDDGHIPLICGGVASLMHNLKGALLETKACVNEMSKIFYTTPRDGAWATCFVLLAATAVHKLTSWLSVTLQVLSATRPPRWEGPMKGPVRVQLHVRGNGWLGYAVSILRRLHTWLRRQPQVRAGLSLLVGVYLVHYMMRWRSMAKLRACHRQLLLLQRIMGCVTFALDEAQQRRARSYVELVAFPCHRLDGQLNEMENKPGARILVESIAYPCDPYLHQYTHGRYYLLKMVLDVLYSSVGVAHKLAGGHRWLALLFLQISGPYFLLNPTRASSYAAGVRQHMRPSLFRFLCWLGNNPAVEYTATLFLMRNHRTSVQIQLPRLPPNRKTYIFQRKGAPPPIATGPGAIPLGRLPFWPRKQHHEHHNPRRPRFPSTSSAASSSSSITPSPFPSPAPSPCNHYFSPENKFASEAERERDATARAGVAASGEDSSDGGLSLGEGEQKEERAKPKASPLPMPQRPIGPLVCPRGGPALIYVHGGGFCTNLFTMDVPFLAQLGEAIPYVPIIISEYSEAPEKPFPCALDEICSTYEWVRAGGLGYIPSRVIVVGESAGANFVAGMVVRYVGHHHPSLAADAGGASLQLRMAVGAGKQPEIRAPIPDEIVLAYPALNLGASPSPSRALHMCDPILPIAAGNLAKAYHRDDPETLLNPQCSPIFTSDAVLSHFPPTSIMTGGMDILLDDAVDFHVRLRRNGVPGRFHIFRTLPHGFWSMGAFLPEAREAQRAAVRWIARAVYPKRARERVRASAYRRAKENLEHEGEREEEAEIPSM